MPTDVEIKTSPYHDKLQRPTGSAVSRDTQLSSQSALSTQSSRPKSAPASKPARQRQKTERLLVSRTLQKQLEDYINKERRETQFSVNGIVTTTKRMEPYDVAYRLIEADMIERASPRNPKTAKHAYRKRLDIEPRLDNSSRRVTQYSEIDRLVENANTIYVSLPINKLANIHRYRPHPAEERNTVRSGNVQGYNFRLGSAIHAHRYVDYYCKSELHSGSPSCSRLKNLPKRKPSEDKDESATESSSSKPRKHTSRRERMDKKNNNK